MEISSFKMEAIKATGTGDESNFLLNVSVDETFSTRLAAINLHDRIVLPHCAKPSSQCTKNAVQITSTTLIAKIN